MVIEYESTFISCGSCNIYFFFFCSVMGRLSPERYVSERKSVRAAGWMADRLTDQTSRHTATTALSSLSAI